MTDSGRWRSLLFDVTTPTAPQTGDRLPSFLVDRYWRRRQPLRAPTPRPRIPSEREPRPRRDRAAEREAA